MLVFFTVWFRVVGRRPGSEYADVYCTPDEKSFVSFSLTRFADVILSDCKPRYFLASSFLSLDDVCTEW